MKMGLAGNSERAAVNPGAELIRPESAVGSNQARAVSAPRLPRRAVQRAGAAHNNPLNATHSRVTPRAGHAARHGARALAIR